MMPCVFIDGEAGTTGLGIRERLRGLPVEVLSIDPDLRKDVEARLALIRAADVVILCLPDDAAREAVSLIAQLDAEAPRLLDASSAHRVSEGWAYGFSELVPSQAGRIATASRVSNPGCYATGAIALLRPLVEAGLIATDTPLTINAVSGYSGGGRQMIAAHERDGGPAFELYALGLEHKHVPEIILHGGLRRRPVFLPSVGHFAQGMIVSIPLHLDMLHGAHDAARLHQALGDHYAAHPGIVVQKMANEATLDAAALAGSDTLELRVLANPAHKHAVLVARLDNLGKGASGAAVQNLLLMLGLNRKDGVHA